MLGVSVRLDDCTAFVPYLYRRNEEYIAPAKAKAIQRLLLDLCSELRGGCWCAFEGMVRVCGIGGCLGLWCLRCEGWSRAPLALPPLLRFRLLPEPATPLPNHHVQVWRCPW